MAIMRISMDLRNAQANKIRELMDAGAGPPTLKIYTAPMPAHPADPPDGCTLLGTLTFSDPSAPAAEDGVLTFSAITEDASADATGTAAWARIADSNGTAIFDVDVGVGGSGCTIILNTTSIVQGGPIRLTSFTITIPEG